MILADKIINERKKNGWSQEELAEKLSVSRQSVSKWEGAQAVPDLQKVIQMADIFGVSTDYLLKDEIETTEEKNTLVEVADVALRKVSMEEANAFLDTVKSTSKKIALGVSLCITSPVLLILLAGGFDVNPNLIKENMVVGLGVVVMLLMIATAVFLFIVYGARREKYTYLEEEDFETQYGVEGMVREKKDRFEQKHLFFTALGVIMCILSIVPVIVASLFEASDMAVTGMFGIMLVIIAIAVYLFITTGSVMNSYKMLLQVEDYTMENKHMNKKLQPLAAVYWSLALAIYLLISFLTTRWGITWVVWPVAGVAYAVVINLAKMFVKMDRA